jgi:putative two-component system response regulator
MAGMTTKKAPEFSDPQNAILCAVTDLVEFRDSTTGSHIMRTQKYLQTLVEQLVNDGVYSDELLSWNMDSVLPAVPLHDVGKISISDAILNKPGRLTIDEYEIMKSHVEKGVEAIEMLEKYGCSVDCLEHAKTFACTHHEKWDGSGYPYGLKGQEIPLEGRIMALADVYDALISERPYKKALSAEESARIIIEGASTHFDPLLVDAFKKLSGEFAAIANDFRNTQEDRIIVQ